MIETVARATLASEAARALGSARSPAKAKTSAANGANKGGRIPEERKTAIQREIGEPVAKFGILEKKQQRRGPLSDHLRQW